MYVYRDHNNYIAIQVVIAHSIFKGTSWNSTKIRAEVRRNGTNSGTASRLCTSEGVY